MPWYLDRSMVQNGVGNAMKCERTQSWEETRKGAIHTCSFRSDSVRRSVPA
jgi:hypothetical protein